MHLENFVKLEAVEIRKILERLNPEFEDSYFDPQQTTILAQALSFYPGFQFLDIVNYAGTPPLRRLVLYSKQKFIILNFSNEPLYNLNSALPIKLDKNNVEDYIRFFFKNVYGSHGRFIVIENVDDIHWKDDPPPTARKAIGKLITPLKFDKIDEHDFYNFKGCMMFKDSLFKVKIKVDPNGKVTLDDEQLLIEDIPVLDNIFAQ